MAPDGKFIENKGDLRISVFKYGDKVIEIVNIYKYLGVWCSSKTNYSLRILHTFFKMRPKQYLQ